MAKRWVISFLEASTRIYFRSEDGRPLPCFLEDAAGRLVWDPTPFPTAQSAEAALVTDHGVARESLGRLLEKLLRTLPGSMRGTYQALYPNLKPIRRPWMWCSLPSTPPPMSQVESLCAALDRGALSPGEVERVKGVLMRVGVCDIPQGDGFVGAFHELDATGVGVPYPSLTVIRNGYLIRGTVHRKALLGVNKTA